MTQTALILGSNGRFGAAAATAFDAAGWSVRKFVRGRDDLAEAVSGVDVVVNAWNPPGYASWHHEMLPLHQSVLDALAGSDKTVIVPGNVYVFGSETPAPWGVSTPHNAQNPLGRLRIQMEAAYRASGVRTILLRGGDFLDTHASGNWFDKVMITKLGKGVFTYPGDLDAPHSWAYLPDMARAAVELAEQRDKLPRFADIPFAGFTLTGRDIATGLTQVLGRDVTPKRMPWWPIRALAPIVPMFRGLPEMRYLWNTPHSLDGSELKQWLPQFTPTPVNAALAQAVAHLGLDASMPGARALNAANA